jgi:hypothetical protein
MAFTIKIRAQLLPKGVKFKEGEVVDWGKKSLKEKSETELKINLVEELKIIPNDIFKHLRVSLGEQVEAQQILAEKKSFFKKGVFKSPQAALVRGIDHLEGTLTLSIEKVVEVPFALEATYAGKEKETLLFKVKEGMEIAITAGVDTSFGGFCSYLEKVPEINLENCENRVVLTKTEDIMDQAKISALSPVALVSYKADYQPMGTPLLLVEKKEDWHKLFAEKYQLCLYLMGQKTIYFYNP